jgi:hypothetical protein
MSNVEKVATDAQIKKSRTRIAQIKNRGKDNRRKDERLKK